MNVSVTFFSKLDLFDKIVIKNDGLCGGKGVLVQDIDFQTKHDATRLKKFEDYYQTQISEMPSDYTKHLGLQ